jgi:hypothetical protein
MFTFISVLFVLFSLAFTNIAAFPLESRDYQSTSCVNSTARTIYEFPNNTWVENLAVRADGKIIVTLINKPDIYLIDPAHPENPLLLATIPGTAGAGGIAEVEPNLFAIAAGNWSVETFQPAPASYSIWTLDFNAGPFQTILPKVKKVTDVPTAIFLNGITTLPQPRPTDQGSHSPSILVSDSVLGVVWKVNLESGDYSIAISSPLMSPNLTTAAVLGINGIHTRGNYLYFTNSFVSLLNRIPIYPNGSASGPDEVYATWPLSDSNLGYVADDFAFDEEGNAWVAQDPSGSIVKVDLERRVELVVGGTKSSLVVGDTAVNFGRTAKDKASATLYVTTNGGMAFPPPTGIIGGKLMAVDTKCGV